MHRIKSILLFVILSYQPMAWAEEITYNHLYQQIENIISEIKLIRFKFKAGDDFERPYAKKGKSPVQSYFKGLEVLEKIIALQKKNNISAVSVPTIPQQNITKENVFGLSLTILEELRRSKKAIGEKDKIALAPLPTGKSQDDIYEKLALASLMLDDIAGDINIDKIYDRLSFASEELKVISKKLRIILKDKELDIKQDTKDKKVITSEYKILNKISRIQQLLNMKRFIEPEFNITERSINEIFSVSNQILVEIIRIKIKLDPMSKIQHSYKAKSKNLDHVLALLKNIEKDTEILINEIKQ